MPQFTMVPNKQYWAVVIIPTNPNKQQFIPMMAILQTDCAKWAEEQGYTKDEYVIKRVWALVNVAQ